MLLAQHSGYGFADTQKKDSFRDATEMVKVRGDRGKHPKIMP